MESTHLCRTQHPGSYAWLHEQLLKHRIHVAGGTAVLEPSMLPLEAKWPRLQPKLV